MGDVTDMMLDGTLCQECGAVFDDIVPTEEEFRAAKQERRAPVGNEAPGHPRTCRACRYGHDVGGRTRA